MWDVITADITEHTGQLFEFDSARPIGGGCINDAFRVEAKDSRRFFVKTNTLESLEQFRLEMNSLRILREAQSIFLPKPIKTGTSENFAYLILEYIELGGVEKPALMGQQLARLHLNNGEHYGWHEDNFIGLAPQKNTPNYDWIDFYRSERLEYQLRLNHEKGNRYTNGSILLEKLEAFFAGYTPVPSLLHGDLWAGNAAYTRNGYPVLFDPASYYGDRETDIAMAELFGGFPTEFFEAYQAIWPLNANYPQRKPLYQLYHVLNHAYLFGGSYYTQADRLINELCASV